MREKFEYFLALCIIKIAKILPESALFALMKFLSIALFYLLKSRRKLAAKNISLAYPDLSEQQADDMAKQNFISISKTLAEILLVYNEKRTLESFIINGEQALEQVRKLAQNGRNILFTTAHFGNWEILAHYFGKHGFKMVIIGREGNNLLIENNITAPFRTKFGNALANKDNAMFKMVKFLKSGHHVGILIDQKTGPSSGIKTKFFGRECITSQSIGFLKLKFDPIIVPIFSLRRDDGRYEIIVKPFDFIPSGNAQDDTFAITQGINDIFEEVIRLAPQQWFWMHNRWKMD